MQQFSQIIIAIIDGIHRRVRVGIIALPSIYPVQQQEYQGDPLLVGLYSPAFS